MWHDEQLLQRLPWTPRTLRSRSIKSLHAADDDEFAAIAEHDVVAHLMADEAFRSLAIVMQTMSQEQREAMLELAAGRPNSLLFL